MSLGFAQTLLDSGSHKGSIKVPDSKISVMMILPPVNQNFLKRPKQKGSLEDPPRPEKNPAIFVAQSRQEAYLFAKIGFLTPPKKQKKQLHIGINGSFSHVSQRKQFQGI